jgi:type I restriction enzyme, S subunit
LVTNMNTEQVAKRDEATRLRDGWQVVRFDQMAECITDRIDNPSEAGVEYYVGLEHLDSESLKIHRWGSPNDVEATKLRFKPGDIIFGRRRAYQRKVAVAEFDGICSAHALVLRAQEETVLKDFLPFFMQSDTFFERAMSISVGSLSPTINWRTLALQEFAIPPKDEQGRIADILWAADDTVLSLQKAEESVNEVLNAIREDIICSPTHPRRKLGDYLIRIVPGRSISGTNKPADHGKFGVLKVSAVGVPEFIADENKQLLNPEDFRPEFQVKAGDFLITRCNTRELVGKVCIVPKDFNNLMLCDKTLRLDFTEGEVCKDFLLEVLRSKELRSQIEAAASGTGGAMKNISQSDIRELQVPLPTIEVQREIVSMIRYFTEARRSVKTHITHSISCRRNLLHHLLKP